MNETIKIISIILLCIAQVVSMACIAHGSNIIINTILREPSDPIVRPRVVSNNDHSSPNPAGILTAGLFYIYQNIIGPTKGARCPMYPSCSEYGRMVFKKYGLLKGIMCTGDRLHRCGHDLLYYKLIRTSRGIYYEDIPH